MAKQSIKIVNERRNKILEYLIQEKSKTVEQLADYFEVSIPTIRRDLLILEEENQISRYHGGASINDESVYCPYIPYKNIKEQIAYEASKFIQDGDTIFINTSSTALLIIKYLKNKHVTIITNNVKAAYVERDPNVNIILTGGELRIPKETLVGEFALNNIQKVKTNKCFLGCSGISDHLTTSVLQEAAINHTMQQQCSGEVFILAESSKIGRNHSFVSGDLSRINYLVTDTKADKTQIDYYKSIGIQVIQIENE